MESTTFQNSQEITIYNKKSITFDIPGWGRTQVSVDESMNAHDLYFFVGIDNIEIKQVIYRVDDLVIEAFKDDSVKFIYETCDDKVVQVIHILENVMETDGSSSRNIENSELWQLTKFIKIIKNLLYMALQELKKFQIKELDIMATCYDVWQDFKFLLEVLDLKGMCLSVWRAVKYMFEAFDCRAILDAAGRDLTFLLDITNSKELCSGTWQDIKFLYDSFRNIGITRCGF